MKGWTLQNHTDVPINNLMISSFENKNSAANKYYSSASHHKWKNKKITGQIKFSAVTIKQQIKLVL